MNLRAIEANSKSRIPIVKLPTYNDSIHKKWRPPKGKTSRYESERITKDTYTIECRACNKKTTALAWSQCKQWRKEHDKKYFNLTKDNDAT